MAAGAPLNYASQNPPRAHGAISARRKRQRARFCCDPQRWAPQTRGTMGPVEVRPHSRVVFRRGNVPTCGGTRAELTSSCFSVRQNLFERAAGPDSGTADLGWEQRHPAAAGWRCRSRIVLSPRSSSTCPSSPRVFPPAVDFWQPETTTGRSPSSGQAAPGPPGSLIIPSVLSSTND